MRICQVPELGVGMILGKSLFNEKGDLLLSSGFALKEQSIQRIREYGFTAVYIMEAGLEDILPEDIISEEVRCKAMYQYHSIEENFDNVGKFRKIKPNELRTVITKKPEFRNLINMNGVLNEITTMLNDVIDSNAAMLNTLQIKSQKAYRREHAIDTALISILIGRNLLLNRRELLELATASFLHDIGKLALPHLVDRPPVSYTKEEATQMREHPVYGNLLMRNSSDGFFMAQTAVLYHHERQDGFGYPLGVKGSNGKHRFGSVDPTKTIYPMAEIIAVADAYDNLISGHYNGKPVTPEQAINTIVSVAGAAFNSRVIKTLANVIAIFPTGSVVRIVDSSLPEFRGCEAVVMKPNSDDPHRPIVVLLRDALSRKIAPKVIDFSAESFARLELKL